MRARGKLVLLCLCLGPACAGASPWPAVDVTARATLRSGLVVGGGRTAGATRRLDVGLRWRSDALEAEAVDGEPASAGTGFGAPREAVACSVPAACEWERDARRRALVALGRAGAP